MAWYSHTVAFAISGDGIDSDSDPRELLATSGESKLFVYAPSRNGCLLWQLENICKQAAHGKNLYLLENICLLNHEAVVNSALQIEALLQEIELNPRLVVEATKEPHRPNLTLLAEGFQPQPAELIYSSDALIKDGWVYNHTEEEVRGLLGQSCASQTPCPGNDDDGESLLYVFNFLRSHLSLLRAAIQAGQVVVYGETNQNQY
jgi:hypothetical protein